jgi:hypothetical protein
MAKNISTREGRYAPAAQLGVIFAMVDSWLLRARESGVVSPIEWAEDAR